MTFHLRPSVVHGEDLGVRYVGVELRLQRWACGEHGTSRGGKLRRELVVERV